MPRDPFDEFKEIEKMFKKMMQGKGRTGGSHSHGISIRTTQEGTKIDVHGDVPEEEIERLKEQYPDADISKSGNNVEDSAPVKVLDEEPGPGEKSSEKEEKEMEPEELALRRLEEKKEEED